LHSSAKQPAGRTNVFKKPGNSFAKATAAGSDQSQELGNNLIRRWKMRIVISATGTILDVPVDPRFGRCQYFISVDPDTLEYEVMENPGVTAGGGAGVATAQAIAAKGTEAVLTGSCGPNAYQVLAAAGIKVITGVTGKVKDVIQNYKAGKYQTSTQPNVPSHFGMGRGPGGGGRGMRRGWNTGRS
jgi:predicted Fe-Mo cluster-binding NifX family protein